MMMFHHVTQCQDVSRKSLLFRGGLRKQCLGVDRIQSPKHEILLSAFVGLELHMCTNHVCLKGKILILVIALDELDKFVGCICLCCHCPNLAGHYPLRLGYLCFSGYRSADKSKRLCTPRRAFFLEPSCDRDKSREVWQIADPPLLGEFSESQRRLLSARAIWLVIENGSLGK